MGRDSKADQVYSALRDEILNGRLKPGESLSVLKVAERFGASRTPVRDAFVRLESDGLVSLIDRQGARVSSISIGSVRDLFEMRIMLESRATQQVAQAAASNSDIQRTFGDLIEQFTQVANDEAAVQHRERFYQLTETYDQAIITYARNQQLSRVISEMRPHIARLRIIAHSPERLAQSVHEHLAMCRAIVDADPDAAANACTDHLLCTEKTILDAVLHSTGLAVPVELVATT
ncbi:GntR family transcriptional regulator [Mycolicibacterium wolinskyi]|uniref:GntR family transcriptional regulator n=1 Tax=Mycolicibacterium wolinskyi TaxID=59750 RepID=A0A132PBZ7_9MYCO|nr:GntR family transcriptional regulator [Mycolicibacterium wolinskyi]KWX19850.1 GntR family transcriptional regulator [Mycolicibacterium wolinskyi]